VGYGHKRVNHSRDEFARQDGTHINGIEGFWALAKVRLARFRGMAPQTFWLHLKECELTTGGEPWTAGAQNLPHEPLN
jgi:transposase-like protein